MTAAPLRGALLAASVLVAGAVVPARADDAVIEGTLQDLSGRPLPGIEIEIVPTDYRGRKAIGTADDEGRFELSPVVPGAYKLRFRGKEIYSLEATGLDASGSPAWEVNGIFDPASLPPLTLGDGQRVLVVAVLVDPGQDVDRDPASFRTRLEQGTSLVQQGQCDQAMAPLRQHLELFPYEARAAYLLGYCLASTGKAEEGVAALEQAAEIDPAMPGVALLLGQVLLQLQRVDEAAEWLRAETEIAGNPALTRDAWLALAFLERDRGHRDAAIEAFERVRELAPDRPEPYSELARLYGAAGEREKLEAVLEAGAAVGRVDLEPLLNLGIHDLEQERFAEADGIFQRASELATDDEGRALAFALLGRSLLRQQRRDKGIAMLRKSLQLDGDGRFAAECRRILDELGARAG